ncbi:PAS domain S-box protein [Pseudoalteromonas denitrificans]|uniref:PAS domain S-box-containing protein n=1 Tax=Pseudoalteromonas denitrificans DSM 6059 TaxID=1123010 RepID=A0A1I1UYK3_9GAMM|nr:PAS domain S-box protein [Pseudoalteromonas denitrificans]SFD75871.1 PAS domain S-box-containing protein [Pseudoalteromonas denitrificans DSM 6059]
MGNIIKSDITDKLFALKLAFKKQLPNKFIEMEQLWQSVCEGDKSKLILLKRLLHNLAGSAGTYGSARVSAKAQELVQQIKLIIEKKLVDSSLSEKDITKFTFSLEKLKRLSEQWQPSQTSYTDSFSFIHPIKKDVKKNSKLIYFVEDDPFFAEDLLIKLEQTQYKVVHFSTLEEFEHAFNAERPTGIIMNMLFDQGELSGAHIIARLKKKFSSFPPVVFLSANTDVKSRLAAVHAGADRYFTKPTDFEKLMQTLDGLTSQKDKEPYKVLIVDDSKSMLLYYESILTDAGIDVKTLIDPLKSIDVMTRFKPELVILDIFMPGCSGLELAQVIRQDDVWAMTPIMFLTSESDPELKVDAMELGGDEFLVKPVEPMHFISSVIAKSKRARWVNQLNTDLKTAIRESHYQLATMDQHDIVCITDIDNKILAINNKFCQISGYEREELLGQYFEILKSGSNPEEFYLKLWAELSQGQVWRGTLVDRKKNGSEYWLETTIVPFLDENGKIYKYVSAMTDITTLMQNKERTRLILETVVEGIFGVDLNGKITFLNPSACKILGYKAKELIGNSIYELTQNSYPDDAQKIEHTNSINESFLTDKISQNDDGILWGKDNHSIPIEYTCSPLKNRNQLIGSVITFRDIRERKINENALLHAKEEAISANKSKSEFLSRGC